MNKSGISAIVATVLVILITVAGVAIIWVGVLPMLSESFEFSELDGRVSVISTGGYTIYDATKEVSIVQIKRNVDEGVMNRIKISFLIGGDSVSSNVVAPVSGGTKTYSFDLSGYGEPDGVEVSPIFVSGSGREKIGSVTSKVDLGIGRINDVRGNVYEIGEDYVYEVSTNGLVSMWTFTDGAKDGWGENDGSLVGGAEVVGGELVLDGSGDYVDVTGVSFPNEDFSFSLWLRMDETANSRGVSTFILSTGGWNFYQHSANNYIYFGLGARFISGAISDNDWHHIVCAVTDAGVNGGSDFQADCYVDSELMPLVQSGYLNPATDFDIGSTGNTLDGQIDNVMLYDRVLSSEEMIAIYEVQKVGKV